jgi:hypothetical protein
MVKASSHWNLSILHLSMGIQLNSTTPTAKTSASSMLCFPQGTSNSIEDNEETCRIPLCKGHL